MNPEVFLRWVMLEGQQHRHHSEGAAGDGAGGGAGAYTERIQMSPSPFRTARVRATGDVQGQDCLMILHRPRCSVGDLEEEQRRKRREGGFVDSN